MLQQGGEAALFAGWDDSGRQYVPHLVGNFPSLSPSFSSRVSSSVSHSHLDPTTLVGISGGEWG
jgi:hypothetical protein